IEDALQYVSERFVTSGRITRADCGLCLYKARLDASIRCDSREAVQTLVRDQVAADVGIDAEARRDAHRRWHTLYLDGIDQERPAVSDPFHAGDVLGLEPAERCELIERAVDDLCYRATVIRRYLHRLPTCCLVFNRHPC